MINLDFADVTAVMSDAGCAHMGVGTATGRDKAEQAAKAAITSPLIETSMENARGVIISITGSMDVGLEEVETAATIISDMAHPDANIIFGAQLDDSLEDEMRITVVATGLGDNKKNNKTNELDILIGNTENKEFDDDIGLLDIFKN